MGSRGSTARFPLFRIAVMRQLFNIVHQAVQLPLPIHLRFPTQRKAVQSLVATQVAKHRFDCRETARDHLPPASGVNLCFHPIDVVFPLIAFALEERHLPCRGDLRFAQAFLATLAWEAILFGATEFHRSIAFVGAVRSIAIESLACRTNAVRMIRRQMEIGRLEALGLFRLLCLVPERIRLGGMHILIRIPFVTLAIAVVGNVGINLPRFQFLQIGVRMIAGICGRRRKQFYRHCEGKFVGTR